jgi:hypothetical protein
MSVQPGAAAGTSPPKFQAIPFIGGMS